jgi:phosphoribosyl 1,2-cyclic phosphate phosphodiesterase
MTLTVTILGCGSSGGVPRVGSGWGACDPTNPKNRRRRCSILVERTGPGGTTAVLVDTSPDLREQLLDAGVTRLDTVIYTHDHADHTHGIDDLRPLVIHMRKRIPVFADDATGAMLMERFGYCFRAPPGSEYPPILDLHRLDHRETLTVHGPGGAISATPFEMAHGKNGAALGFRFGSLAYASDVSALPPESVAQLEGLDWLLIDALRYTPHPTHFSVSDALQLIAQVKPGRAVLTNLHTDVDYARLAAEVPANVEPAYDGMRISLPDDFRRETPEM